MSDAEEGTEYRIWLGGYIEAHLVNGNFDWNLMPTAEQGFLAGYAAASADTARLVRAAVEATIYAAATRQRGDAIDIDALIRKIIDE